MKDGRMTISDEAVEAAARAYAECVRLRLPNMAPWDDLPFKIRAMYIDDQRVALAAIFPDALAGAWDEGWDAGTLSQFTEPLNPYRSAK